MLHADCVLVFGGAIAPILSAPGVTFNLSAQLPIVLGGALYCSYYLANLYLLWALRKLKMKVFTILLNIYSNQLTKFYFFRLPTPRRLHQGEVGQQRALRDLLHQPPRHDQGRPAGHSERNLLVSDIKY